jgi:DNA polymerase-3 subunit gamma/tau
MAEFAHLATRFKLAPETADSAALTPEEKRRGQAAAEKLSIPTLTRAWQILMKGVDELRASQRPLQAADMVLVRLAYAADLPTPGEALKQLAATGGASAGGSSAPSGGAPRSGAGGPATARLASSSPRAQLATQAAPATPAPVTQPIAQTVAIASFEALVALAEEKRDMRLKLALDSDVRLVRFEPGRIEFELAPGGARDLASTLTQKLQLWTNERWMVSIVAAGGAPTLKEQRTEKEQARRSSLEADPMVAAVLTHFPGAQIVAVRGRDDGVATSGDAAPTEDEVWDDASPIEED